MKIFMLSKIGQTQEDVRHMFLKHIEPKDKSNRHEGRKYQQECRGVSVLVAIMTNASNMHALSMLYCTVLQQSLINKEM